MPLLAKNTEVDYSHLEEAGGAKTKTKPKPKPKQASSNSLGFLTVAIQILVVCLITFLVWKSSFVVYRLRGEWKAERLDNELEQRMLLEQVQQPDLMNQQPHVLNTIAILSSIEGSMDKLFSDIMASDRTDDGGDAVDDDQPSLLADGVGSAVFETDDQNVQLLQYAIQVLETQWQEFIVKYNKKYENAEEMEKRRAVFYKNALYVAKHNRDFSQNASAIGFTVELNGFADQESDALADLLNGYGKRLNVQGVNSQKAQLTRKPFVRRLSDEQLPVAVDWREQGAVTNVKNQGQCGSCWAFSATGALEGQLYKKNGYLTSLSEQNLVDCSADEGNNGCNGGLMDNAFQYIMDNNGIDTEAEYPYKARRGRCAYVNDKLNLTDYGFFDIKSGDEKALQEAVATIGPISIAIDASQRSFQLYHRGVYKDRRCSPKELDHGVLVVGYGHDERDGDFWIVKNSWSDQWGEDGYIRMARNKRNMCGVATQASFPKV